LRRWRPWREEFFAYETETQEKSVAPDDPTFVWPFSVLARVAAWSQLRSSRAFHRELHLCNQV
jgi:hypothetical protein